MKKKLLWNLAVLLVTVLNVGFASCGDDDDEDNGNPIVGKWVCEGTDPYAKFTDTRQIKSDGRMIITWDYELNEGGGYTRRYSCTYQVEGNKLTIIDDDTSELYDKETGKFVPEHSPHAGMVNTFWFTIIGNKLMMYYNAEMTTLFRTFTKR